MVRLPEFEPTEKTENRTGPAPANGRVLKQNRFSRALAFIITGLALGESMLLDNNGHSSI